MYLKAHKELKYSKVIDAIDIAAHAGVRVTAMITDPIPGTKSIVAGDNVVHREEGREALMSMSAGSDKGLTNEPNVTPMIDVLLVLLIIFMMIIPLSRKAIDVQLPDPTPTEGTAEPEAGPDRARGPSGPAFDGYQQASGGQGRT